MVRNFTGKQLEGLVSLINNGKGSNMIAVEYSFIGTLFFGPSVRDVFTLDHFLGMIQDKDCTYMILNSFLK